MTCGCFQRQCEKTFGQALDDAQWGKRHPKAKPLQGFGGAGVLEVVESERAGTYRAVYTVRFSRRVYVLHAFQKKSKSGTATPREEIERIKRRLKEAERDYAEWIKTQAEPEGGG
jgi:phage-related protein